MTGIRQLTPADIPAALELCRFAGWNQLEEDWKIFLQESSSGCFAATDMTGKVVGTLATITYSQQIAWIGMVLVHPECRRTGIGTALLQQAITYLVDVPGVKLDATQAGREVYLKLGFVDEYPLRRMVLNAYENNNAAEAVKMSHLHLPGILQRDIAVFGADRGALLRRLFDSAPDFAWINKENDAYCFSREGHDFCYIGPIVAENIDGAKKVLTAALNQCKRMPVAIDVNLFSEEWNEWLMNVGFTEQRRFMRMYKGSNNSPGVFKKQFGISGPEFG